MGVFSYLNIKKPASLIWKAFSPSRDVGEGQGSSSDLSSHVNKAQSLLCSPGQSNYCSLREWFI